MTEAIENTNPLLQIDTGFRSYLNAYTRSFQNHMVNGQLDYAFESDFAVRQKIMGLGGWGRLAKAINTVDISAEAKLLFMKCDQAGALKYPEIYNIAKRCAERLELNLPIVFVRNDITKPLIYSIVSDLIDPCIVLTEWLVRSCTQDELTLLIGCECGRLQNNHSTFNWAFTYLNHNKNVYKPVERSHKSAVSNQLVCSLIEWVKYADITADRAGIICLDEPGRFCEIICSLYNKGFIDFYGRQAEGLNSTRLTDLSQVYSAQSARALKVDPSLSDLEKRILASNEFLNCESIFAWRDDLGGRPSSQKVTSQGCDVRASMLLGTGGGN
ncbi:MAG: hypothetical protein IKP47_05060 [Ruminococcus sp.]|nr:hypothetical protein [Ruminococcus sp.]